MRSPLQAAPAWHSDWSLCLRTRPPSLSDKQAEACARLVQVLLVGEQSAIRIFSAEIARRRSEPATAALRALQGIELDEHQHECALQAFAEYLPVTEDSHSLKRRAQKFFAKLGRAENIGGHFGQISQLDSAVCKIMWHVERSSLQSIDTLKFLAARIKQDEAQHVVTSRRYAAGFGLAEHARLASGETICQDLVTMLQPLTASFEAIGVDSDKLFRHIHSPRLP